MAIVNIYARARKPSHPAEPSEDLLKLLEYVCTRMQDFNFVTMSKREIEKSLGGEQAAVNAVEFLSVTLSFPQTNRETDGASILFYLSLPPPPNVVPSGIEFRRGSVYPAASQAAIQAVIARLSSQS